MIKALDKIPIIPLLLRSLVNIPIAIAELEHSTVLQIECANRRHVYFIKVIELNHMDVYPLFFYLFSPDNTLHF